MAHEGNHCGMKSAAEFRETGTCQGWMWAEAGRHPVTGLELRLRGIGFSALYPHGTVVHFESVVVACDGQKKVGVEAKLGSPGWAGDQKNECAVTDAGEPGSVLQRGRQHAGEVVSQTGKQQRFRAQDVDRLQPGKFLREGGEFVRHGLLL